MLKTEHLISQATSEMQHVVQQNIASHKTCSKTHWNLHPKVPLFVPQTHYSGESEEGPDGWDMNLNKNHTLNTDTTSSIYDIQQRVHVGYGALAKQKSRGKFVWGWLKLIISFYISEQISKQK